MGQESSSIRALHTAYQASLETKADELGRLEGNELPEFLHRLAGSAGMYGYTEIAELARELLDFCEAQKLKPENDSLPDYDFKSARQNLMSLLRDA